MDKFKKLKHSLREVSYFDKIRSFLSTHPPYNESCGLYDKWLNRFLKEGVKIISIDQYHMRLKNTKGEVSTFWVGNYPHRYGNRTCIPTSHPYWRLYPSWDLVFKLRELQLSRKDEVIQSYIRKMTSCN